MNYNIFMKKIILFLFLILFLAGCSNNDEAVQKTDLIAEDNTAIIKSNFDDSKYSNIEIKDGLNVLEVKAVGLSDGVLNKDKDSMEFLFRVAINSDPIAVDSIKINKIGLGGAFLYTFKEEPNVKNNYKFSYSFLRGPTTKGFISRDDILKVTIPVNLDITSVSPFLLRVEPGIDGSSHSFNFRIPKDFSKDELFFNLN